MSDNPLPSELHYIILKIINGRNGEAIRSKINLQKIAFLILENYPDLFEKADYKRHLEGPYSEPIVISTDELILDKEVEKQKGFQITEKGKEILQDADSKINPDKLAKLDNFIEQIKGDFNKFRTDEILAYVYKKYPQYVENSIRAPKLNYEKIFLKLYEKGELGISKIAELMGKSYEEVYELIQKKAKRIIVV
jgi:uncharacterized protein YwgA